MKKKLVFMALMLALFISILVFSGKARASNSELYENDKQIITLLEDYEKEYNHTFKLATKEIEKKLFGKWKVEETLGYRLKSDVTGGALDDGKLDLSKDTLIIYRLHSVLDEKLLTTGEFEYISTTYKNPVFAYYQETMGQMKQDDFLDNYTGIDGIKPNTVGTVIIAMGIPSDSLDSYEIVLTKFIIIEDYVIAVNQSSFYELNQI